jgi:hypothetical protein
MDTRKIDGIMIKNLIAENKRGIAQYQFDMIRGSLETVASQALNAITPNTIEQAKDNLRGLAILIESACATHGVVTLHCERIAELEAEIKRMDTRNLEPCNDKCG